MSLLLHKLQHRRVGLALSGGAARGIAHIGVIKALNESGIKPAVVAGTSVGSIIGAGVAAGASWQELRELAHKVFWPSLLHGRTLENFCSRNLPESFEDLALPFAAVATSLPARRPHTVKSGRLACAISASCALWLRRPVHRNGEKLSDGGFTCVLPSEECRKMGADFIIASDVWELSALLRGVGVTHTHKRARHAYPKHYLNAVKNTDLLIQPQVALKNFWPGHAAIDRLIAAGEAAAHRTLRHIAS